MLKHVTTPSSSPSPLESLDPTGSTSSSNKEDVSSNSSGFYEDSAHNQRSNNKGKAWNADPSSAGTFRERSVDGDDLGSSNGIRRSAKSFYTWSVNASNYIEDIWWNTIGSSGGSGPVITRGKAIVRRGLSFNIKREYDAVSLRSTKSEIISTANSSTQIVSSFHSLPEEGKWQLSNPFRPAPKPGPVQNENEPQKKLTVGTPEANPEREATSPESNSSSPHNNHRQKGSSQTTFHMPKRIPSLYKKKECHSLKSLLRLPGVFAHIQVPVQGRSGDLPHLINHDSLSLTSADSFLSSTSGRNSSRSWSSNASSNSTSSNSNCSSSSGPPATTLKVFARCLRSDIEYKTVSVCANDTAHQLISLLLSKARMRHRDPKLYYLTMEVTIRRWSGSPEKALLVLEETACPAQLALCRPAGDIKFALQMRRGGLIRVHDTVLMPGSQYKSLFISHQTTSLDVVQLLLNCYNRKESKYYYALHEVCQSPVYKDRRMDPDECPLESKAKWPRDRKAELVFVLRRNMAQAMSLRKLSQKNWENRTEKERHSGPNRMPITSAHQMPISEDNNPEPSNENFRRKPFVEAELFTVCEDSNDFTLSRSRSHSLPTHNRIRGDAIIDCTTATPVVKRLTETRYPPRTITLVKSNCVVSKELLGGKTSLVHSTSMLSSVQVSNCKGSNDLASMNTSCSMSGQSPVHQDLAENSPISPMDTNCISKILLVTKPFPETQAPCTVTEDRDCKASSSATHSTLKVLNGQLSEPAKTGQSDDLKKRCLVTSCDPSFHDGLKPSLKFDTGQNGFPCDSKLKDCKKYPKSVQFSSKVLTKTITNETFDHEPQLHMNSLCGKSNSSELCTGMTSSSSQTDISFSGIKKPEGVYNKTKCVQHPHTEATAASQEERQTVPFVCSNRRGDARMALNNSCRHNCKNCFYI